MRARGAMLLGLQGPRPLQTQRASSGRLPGAPGLGLPVSPRDGPAAPPWTAPRWLAANASSRRDPGPVAMSRDGAVLCPGGALCAAGSLAEPSLPAEGRQRAGRCAAKGKDSASASIEKLKQSNEELRKALDSAKAGGDPERIKAVLQVRSGPGSQTDWSAAADCLCRAGALLPWAPASPAFALATSSSQPTVASAHAG